ncbi:hypothetical protein FDECE_11997 [Fusarium decemcellulare]|nr:hypothetical protein FDECE_11997 [Fusarium decemcellulare]
MTMLGLLNAYLNRLLGCILFLFYGLGRFVGSRSHDNNQPKNPRGDLSPLPLELVDTIATFLPDSSLFCFALTSNIHYSLLRRRIPSIRQIERVDREILLQLLERDDPSLIFCHLCVQLHPWSYWNRMLVRAASWYYFHKALPCNLDYPWRKPIWRRPREEFWIPHARTQLVLHQHKYGPAHGLPLKVLEWTTPARTMRDGRRFRWSCKARIIDDELVLRKTLKVWHYRGENSKNASIFENSYFIICDHISTEDETSVGGYCIPQLKDGPNGPVPCENSPGSCPVCQTDYSITITWQDGWSSGWFITIVIYECARNQRDIFNGIWKHMSISNRPYREIVPAGALRNAWNREDGVAADAGGGFAAKA